MGTSCVNSQVISRSLCAAVGLVLGCLLACPESWLRRLCVVGFRVILAILGAPDPCLKTTVVTVMSTELPVDTVSADDQLDALIAEHRLREQNSGTLDGSTLGTASVAQLASHCSVPRALAPPLPSGQNCLQLAPAAAQLIAGELSLNPLGVLAPASAPCSAPLPALPCPTVAASPNMSVFVQPSLGDLSVLSSCYPAPSTVAGSPLPLLDRVVPDQHVEPSGCGVPCTQSQLAVVHDSHGAVTPTAGTHGSVEHYSMSPEAIPVSGYHLGSVESHRLLDASELDRVKYIVEVLRSENVAIKEVLEQVVSSTKSELVSMNSRFTAAFGELRDMLGNVNHQDFNTMKHEIDRLCDHAMSVAPKFAEIDRTIQAVYMRCDGIVFDSDKRFEEQRSDYVDRLRGLSENMSGRFIELENFVQSQLAGYREQFLSIDRRFGKIEAKLASIGVAPSVHASMPSSPQQVGFPTLSQNFVQQPTNVPVPASDGQSFRSYMSHDHHGVDEHHSTSSGRTQRTLERQRPILPRETGMLRRPVEGSPVVAVGHQYVTRPIARSLQQHDSVIPRERSALKSNPLPCAYEAAPAEHVAPQLDPNTQMSSEQSQGANSNIPGMASFVENAQRHAGVSREVKHEGSCMASGNQVRPAVEVVPSRVITQTSSPAPVVVEQKAPIVVEQKGVSPSPKACIQYARTTPGWPVQPRKQPGFAEDVSFPQRIQFDDRSVPCGGAKNRWVDAMLGRTGYINSSHVVESTTGTLIAPAPTEAVSAALPITFAQIRSPDHPVTFGEACASHSEHRQGEYAPSNIMPPSGAAASGDGGNQNPSGNNVGDGWHHIDPSHNPVPSPPSGPPGGPFGGGGGGGSGPPGGPSGGPPGGGGSGGDHPDDHGLFPPDMRSARPAPKDEVLCERCGHYCTRASARNCVSCQYRCCPICCPDPMRICKVCLERATGNPISGGSGPDRRPSEGQDVRKDDQKAKCKSITLEKEPAPNQLRAWIVDLKEKVANAFAYDTEYALRWVEIPEDADYDSLSAPCKYGNLENEFNAALRQCVTSPPLKAKINMETERMHSLSKRLVSRQILWMLYEHLRPNITGDTTFKMIEFMRLSSDRFTKGTEEERLEAFMNKWDSVLAGITVDRPPEHVLTALFYEQVHTFKCLALDMALWQRDKSVRNYAYLRSVATNAVQMWRMRNNQERMYHATRNSSGSPRVLAVQRGSSSGRKSDRSRSLTPGGRHRRRSTPRKKTSRSNTPPGGKRKSSPHRALPARTGSPNRRTDRSRSNTRSPNGRFVCRDFQRGKCARGDSCKYSHSKATRNSSPKFKGRSMSPISKESGICFYYARGRCTRDKCPYKHEKPAAPVEVPAAPVESSSQRRTDSPAPLPQDF